MNSASETTLGGVQSPRGGIDERMMARALELAARGAGLVSPGPMVGCVLARGGAEIVGEGFYVYENLKHAETLALEQAGSRARGATAYVTLEPHAHHGRTPPCTTALVEAGVARVVAPTEDPNPLVSGRGFAELRAAGVEVSTGLLAREAERLNEKYFHWHRAQRPFIHLKLATTLDGRIATRTGDSRWITGEEARARAQLLRHEADAILVGAGTAAADDPLLTDRSNLPRRRPLVRVVLDDRLHLPTRSRLAQTAREWPVIVFTSTDVSEESAGALEGCGVEVIREAGGARDPALVLKHLKRRELQSVLVEGGATAAGHFLDAGLVDKLTLFVAPIVVGGIAARPAVGGQGFARIAEALRLRDVELTRRGEDFEITGYPESRGQRLEVRG